MSNCTNESVGQMLHDYELGHLKEQECESFELHLFECDKCFEESRGFLELARLMRHRPEIIRALDSSGPQPQLNGATRKFTQFKRYFLAAVVILAVGIPLYNRQSGGDGTAIKQRITLLPTRGSQVNVIHLDKGGVAEIRFVIEGAKPGVVYHVAISHVGGDTVFEQSDFSEFNPQGQGKLLLDITRFQAGFYILAATNQNPDSVDGIGIRYPFQVK